MAAGADAIQDGRKVASEGIRICGDGAPKGSAIVARPPERCGAIRIAEPHPSRLGDRQRLLRAPGDRLALLLGNKRHDAGGEIIRLGHVAGKEPDTAVPEREQKGGIARQPVELGDDERGASQTGKLDGLAEFGPVGVSSALDLGEAGEDRSTP